MDAIILHTGIAHHNGDWNWQDVRSPFARIYLVTEGEAEIVFKNRAIGTNTTTEQICRLKPGNLYLVPPFTTHSNRCTGVFTHYYIHIYESAEAVSGLFEDYSLPCEVKAENIDKGLFERLCFINSGKNLPQSDPRSYDNPETLQMSVAESRVNRKSTKMESNGIVNQLLARFLTNATSNRSSIDSRVQQARSYIRQNLHKTIAIDSLADMAHLSNEHFIRLFKSECGESPLQYINHRKIELAEIQLITTKMSIKEIATNLAFADYSYFIRIFHQTTDTTPAAYRMSAVKAKT